MSNQSARPKQNHTAELRHVFWRQAGPNDSFPANPKFAMRLGPPQQRWSLRLDPASATTPSSAGGFDLSQPINQLRETTLSNESKLLSCRLGPDEWLLTSNTTPSAAIDTSLTHDLISTPHTLVDVSHRNVALELTGAHVPDVLNTGCPLDLSDQTFPVGTATRTLFSKAEIVLIRHISVTGTETYQIECWRSFARYLSAHLEDSARLLGLSGL